jgi:DNA-binding GntR family transcriptional regulator
MGLLFKQSLSDQIYEVLRRDIITQKIKCGDRLNIRELQDRLSSSATPIREAINRLQQEGLVDYVSNVGAKVNFTV